ncbi:TPA_asm: hypothetical protein GND03_003492 [Salmonella enterica subsp. houtenae serovar 16:z4,z32:-]|uniref:Uncharacterized protein n=1 Tax=Salmonella enterica subsp. houtenae serovar 16:z4,z32:- TaxID=1307497 RepID=A0A735KQ24_SALHO|nr:hypothetical protein [Salmonella enterica]EDW2152812.1 hypothetical protein [Salmonella enterica subsp. houtenae]EGI6408041.1 hypothetical protein [Salmonella enterica subsp. houtenae serovar 16:z4,z32:-]EAP8042286.1 hypothetical protein [Salmonella enterica]EBU1099487.1 hypothetical protein [Salmonella enterica]
MFEKNFFEKNTRLMKSYINLNYKTLITTYNPGTSNSLVAIFFRPCNHHASDAPHAHDYTV